MKHLSFLIIIATILFTGCAKDNNSHLEINALPFFLGKNISCVCTQIDTTTNVLFIGTENGEVHVFDTETGLFSKMNYPSECSSYEDAVYQIIVSKNETLFSIRNHGLIDAKGNTYTIKDKQSEYSAYSTVFPIQGDTFYAATSNGLYAFKKGHFDSADSLWRTSDINSDKKETDKQRFYSLWLTEDGELYAASESGLWYKDKTSAKARIIDTHPCQYISPFNKTQANVLFKDGQCYVLNTQKKKIDDTIRPSLFSESTRILSRIRKDKSVEEGDVIGLGLGVLQANEKAPLKLPYVTQQRYENIKHFAAKVGDYIYIGNSFNLLRIPFYDKNALYKNGISIVSLCLDYKDTTLFYALTNEGRLFSIKKGEKIQSTELGVLNGYKPGDELIGKLIDGLYVKRGGSILLFEHDYNSPPKAVQIESSIKCVAPLNERSLVIGTTDNVFVYSNSKGVKVDSIRVPKVDELNDDISPQLIRVSEPTNNPTVFLHTLNHGSFILQKDTLLPYQQLTDVRDIVFFDGDKRAHVLSKDGHVYLLEFCDGRVIISDTLDFNTPIRRIASNQYQLIGIPDGFDIRGGAIGLKEGNNHEYLTPDSFVYSMVVLKDRSVVLGCDDYISVIAFNESSRGLRYDGFRVSQSFNWLMLVAILLGVVLLFGCILLWFLLKRQETLSANLMKVKKDNLSLKTELDDYTKERLHKQETEKFNKLFECFKLTGPDDDYINRMKDIIKRSCNDCKSLQNAIDYFNSKERILSEINKLNVLLKKISSYLDNYSKTEKPKSIKKEDKEAFILSRKIIFEDLSKEEISTAEKYSLFINPSEFGEFLLYSFVGNETIDAAIARGLGSHYGTRIIKLEEKVGKYVSKEHNTLSLLSLISRIAKKAY